MGIECKLYVASTLYLKCANYLECAFLEHTAFFACESLARTYDDRVTGVYSDGVNVFHVAYRNGGVVGVSHYLVLYFFVALYALFNKNLCYGRKRESVLEKLTAFFLIVCKTASGSAESKCRAENNRISYFLCGSKTFLDRVCYK